MNGEGQLGTAVPTAAAKPLSAAAGRRLEAEVTRQAPEIRRLRTAVRG